MILCDGETLSVEESWLQSESSPRTEGDSRLVRLGPEQERKLIEAALAEAAVELQDLPWRQPSLGFRDRPLKQKSGSWAFRSTVSSLPELVSVVHQFYRLWSVEIRQSSEPVIPHKKKVS